jgi:hypothetical protein
VIEGLPAAPGEIGGAMTLYWLNPLALAGLAAAALPVIIHLLKRHRATRVPFPTLRFLTDSRAAAVKLRSLSDPLAAGPARRGDCRGGSGGGATGRRHFVAAGARRSANSRAPSLSTRARARTRSPAHARRLLPSSGARTRSSSSAGDRVGASLCRAATALLDGPVARHEIVVISDFQHGTINDAEIACVPPDVGLRFVQIANEPRGKYLRHAGRSSG